VSFGFRELERPIATRRIIRVVASAFALVRLLLKSGFPLRGNASGDSQDETGRFRTLCCNFVLSCLFCGAWVRVSPAADHSDGFDSDKPSWQVVIQNRADVALKSRSRTTTLQQSGEAAELIEVTCQRDGVRVELHHELPPSVPLEDLQLSLGVRSNRGNLTLAVRVVFPNQIDPRSGKIMTALVPGESYSDAGGWKTLRVRPDRPTVSQRTKRLRAELRQLTLDLSGAYIDRVVLLGDLPGGTAGFVLDDLNWTGYASPQQNIVQTDATGSVETSKIAMKLDRLLIDGRPVVLRYVPHHGEELSRFAQLGLNAVWIDDYRNAARIRELRELGLWAMATPPRGQIAAPGPTGEDLLSLAPFNASTDGIVAWNISTRAPASALDEVENHVRLIRSADRERNRPIFGDIGGAERAYSRILDAVGLSRHPLQTEFKLQDYRRFLSQKSQKLRPGTFVATWVQTEVDPDNYPAGPNGPVPVIEPEQIRLLTWSAICAGSKGIGFWKRTSFEVDVPGARERELAIAIVNQEISLLEPWLATHSVIEYQPIPIRAAAKSASNTQSNRSLTVRSRARELREEAQKQAARKKVSPQTRPATGPNHVEMAIISGPNGQLLIPLWYQDGSQFVPGQMATSRLEITIPGIQDTATIWEVSTTQVRSLPKKPGPGGAKIVLENFDQVSALMISTDPNWGRILRQRIEQIRERSASLWMSLASEKLARVKQIDGELQRLGAGNPESVRLLQQAETLMTLARKGFPEPDAEPSGILGAGYTPGGASFHNVRTWSAAAMRALRILQRAHWEEAIRGQSSPLSSPWTVSFNTLPDHWRFMRQAGNLRAADTGPVSGVSGNLLPAGGFENTDTARMIKDGWKHSQGDLPGIRASAELTQLRGDSGASLRLVAIPDPNQEIPVSLSGTPISIQTPPISVKAGEIVRITGRVRVPASPVGSLEGVTVYESLAGSRLHWERTRGWQNFELLREVPAASDFTLKLTLHGLGEARFDDLQIIAWNPLSAGLPNRIQQTGDIRPGPIKPSQGDGRGRLGGLDFLRGFRRVP
jgi:hypothetical protein